MAGAIRFCTAGDAARTVWLPPLAPGPPYEALVEMRCWSGMAPHIPAAVARASKGMRQPLASALN
jgi:hypothetical protein